MELPTNANICEVAKPGEVAAAYYPVNLIWIPQVGDMINLTSFVDMSHNAGDFMHQFKVVAVVHQIKDVCNKTDPISKGSQFVNVYVEPIEIPKQFSD